MNHYFTNEYDAAKHHSFLKILQWRFSYTNPQKQQCKLDDFRPCCLSQQDIPNKNEDKIIWLGHAAFIIDIQGVRLLIDPCLTNPPFIKRKTPVPFLIEDIDPDLLLISHGHYDHFDLATINRLGKKNYLALMPIGLASYAKRTDLNCIEMQWYEEFRYGEITVVFLPAYHWHSRYGFDKNRALWGSFLIRFDGMQIYFCGDSGYNNHFQLIRKKYGDNDICIMPIGAYKPDFIMQHSHMNPQESIQAFHDLGGKIFIPMHYGTFKLSDEPSSEGIRTIRNAARNNLIQGRVKELCIGESASFESLSRQN